MGFVWGTYCLGSCNLLASRVEVFALLYCAYIAHLQQNALCTGYAMLLLLFDTPVPGLKKMLLLVWCDSTPNWILDGFKFQATAVSLWWTTGKGGAGTIELACRVKTWVCPHHQLLLANDCSKMEEVYPNKIVNNNFLLATITVPFDRRKFRSQTSDNMDRWKAE